MRSMRPIRPTDLVFTPTLFQGLLDQTEASMRLI
jgi:hypothetical protein